MKIYDFKTFGQTETEALAARFSQNLKAGDMVAMYGDLGAGKTAFTRGVAQGLGYSCPITSPTFAIVNEYRGGRLPLAHFDMYRITGESDLYSTGFYDYLDSGFCILCEWCENIPFAVEDDAISLAIEKGEGDERHLHFESARELEF